MSGLLRNLEDRFSHDAAHLMLKINDKVSIYQKSLAKKDNSKVYSKEGFLMTHSIFEPRREKISFLHIRKLRCRSALRLLHR